ncbi:MAG: phosphohydrolase [Thermoprotei archaeon]|nr:MAG: phosphohydrolase [Thermoprotei archaeon]
MLSLRAREDEVISRVLDFVREKLGSDPAHGLEHTLRVYGLALRIAAECAERGVRVNLFALRLAALLHDIGRACGEAEHHALASARIARQLLAELGVSGEVIDRVCEAIVGHSFSLGREPSSVEGKILSDADKLDAMGAVGVARCFMTSGVMGRGLRESVAHFHEKLLRLKDLLFTEPARRMAERRHEFMEEFLRELSMELAESEPTA